MSSANKVEAFQKLDVTDLPDVHGLKTDRLQVLWVLAGGKRKPELQSLSASQISDILRDSCGIVVSRQRVSAILRGERSTIAKSGKGTPPEYALMKKGVDELLGSGIEPLYIDPNRALTGIRQSESIFASLCGQVRICDAYVGSRTLDYLGLCPRETPIRLLTENVQDSGRFRRDLAAFAMEHATPLEVRQTSAGTLHDRYVIHDNGMFLFGGSIKDIGKKQSMIVALSNNFATEMTKVFDRAWAKATKFR